MIEHSGRYCPQNGKMSYGSEFYAMQALARIKAYRPNLKAFYQCPHCGEWHLTSQEQR